MVARRAAWSGALEQDCSKSRMANGRGEHPDAQRGFFTDRPGGAWATTPRSESASRLPDGRSGVGANEAGR